MIPGEIITKNGTIILNKGKKTITVKVANTGDRAIQVGSHYHFYETNEFLSFERNKTIGFRLNILLSRMRKKNLKRKIDFCLNKK